MGEVLLLAAFPHLGAERRPPLGAAQWEEVVFHGALDSYVSRSATTCYMLSILTCFMPDCHPNNSFSTEHCAPLDETMDTTYGDESRSHTSLQDPHICRHVREALKPLPIFVTHLQLLDTRGHLSGRAGREST